MILPYLAYSYIIRTSSRDSPSPCHLGIFYLLGGGRPSPPLYTFANFSQGEQSFSFVIYRFPDFSLKAAIPLYRNVYSSLLLPRRTVVPFLIIFVILCFPHRKTIITHSSLCFLSTFIDDSLNHLFTLLSMYLYEYTN